MDFYLQEYELVAIALKTGFTLWQLLTINMSWGGAESSWGASAQSMTWLLYEPSLTSSREC